MEAETQLEKFQKDILQNYLCIICQNYAVDIQVSTCSCCTVFCKECSKPVKKCPICQKELNLNDLSFRTVNILRDIPEYKIYEAKIKEEQGRKVPTIEDIQAIWENSTYHESFNAGKDTEAEVKKVQELARKIIYNLAKKFVCKKGENFEMVQTGTHAKGANWFPAIMVCTTNTDSWIATNKPVVTYLVPTKNKCYHVITLIFTEKLENIEIPPDIVEQCIK